MSGDRRISEPQQTLYTDKLDGTASNLYNFLVTLTTKKRATFKKIETSFIQIFPEVEMLSPEMMPNNTSNVLFHFKGDKEPKPIQQCGSGYFHVLALVTLLHIDSNSLVILFDEPNSYLHPSAEKAIYDTISLESNHQFIFTSHSPILINYYIAKTIYLVTKTNGCSEYRKLEEVGDVLKDIGIQNSDFAFSNRVIFVEGIKRKIYYPLFFQSS